MKEHYNRNKRNNTKQQWNQVYIYHLLAFQQKVYVPKVGLELKSDYKELFILDY